MREVTARARSGYLIVLDQCPQCGGIWCDRWELFPLAAEEVARLDAVDTARLQTPMPTTDAPGRCPRCQCALQPFRDAALPPDARIERCQVCDGMWMNRGELTRAKRRTPLAKPFAGDAVQRLATAYGSSAEWSKVGNLDAATYASEDEDPPADLSNALWSAAPWVVLRTLLHLLLRV
jgi:Zn-finger nucleic acid-binding protein